MTASDPSMWDQQPHHECSANNNGNESPDYACRLLAPNRPTQPALLLLSFFDVLNIVFSALKAQQK